jgi:hypothetical protein
VSGVANLSASFRARDGLDRLLPRESRFLAWHVSNPNRPPLVRPGELSDPHRTVTG